METFATSCRTTISIHALREEGDAQIEVKVFDDFLFLSTPSARRATLPIPSNHLEGEYFYPRPPRGGRRSASSSMTASSIFLSTPSARRATRTTAVCSPRVSRFLSTPSARRATTAHQRQKSSNTNFYPRPPRGGRQPDIGGGIQDFTISIHALREEGDAAANDIEVEILNFYPRPPRGGRRYAIEDILLLVFISIHALREEGDFALIAMGIDIIKFLSTPSARRATPLSGVASKVC